MTTAADLGMVEPVGSDLISTGDDDIAHNARRMAVAYDALKADTRSVVAPVSNRVGMVEEMAAEPGTRVVNHIIDPAPVDTVNTWTAGNATLQQATIWGRAIAAGGAGVSVTPKLTMGSGEDINVKVSTGDPVAARMIIRAMDSQQLSATLYVRGWSWNGSSFTFVETIATSGQLHINPDQAVTFTATGFVPSGVTHVDTYFTFRRFGETYPMTSDFVYFRLAALFAGSIPDPLVYVDGEGEYSYWEGVPNLSASVTMRPRPGSAGGASAHAVLLDDFTNRRGGRKIIGKKTSISFRVDHGLANFTAKMRPVMETHGFPYALALGSRDWGATENTGVTPAIVNGWVTAGLAEVWSHGISHADADTPAKLRDYIVNSRIELERDIPAATVDGFMPPGAGGTRYMGFGPSDTPQKYFDTLAGQLILQTYAIGTGQMLGTAYRVQDGVPRVGQAYFNMDTFDAAGVMSRVGNAIAEGKGIQLMIHPSLIDTAGHITTAELKSLLDQIKALQDDGTVLVMSAYDQLLADATGPVWDTGEVDISSLLVDATGSANVSRVGPIVYLSLEGVAPTTSISGVKITLPLGYRPATRKDFTMPGTIGSASPPWRSTYIFTNGGLGIWSPTTTDNYRYYLSFRTNDPFPA